MPLLDKAVTCPPFQDLAALAPAARLRDRAGSQQLAHLWPSGLQKGIAAGSWRVASSRSSWRMITMAAVSYLEVEGF